VKRDPNQAARFFGNIPSMGSGAWLQDGQWDEKLSIRERPKSVPVCAGFDGSDVDDWTGIRLETFDLHQFTPLYHNNTRRTIWNPALWPGHRTPRAEVMAAWDHIFQNYDVVRAYMDPPLYASEINHLQGKYGDKVVIEWPTYRIKPMHAALERLKTDIINPDSGFTHDDCAFTALHMRNAVERARTGNTYILGKASDQQKIDLTMSSVLAHEAVSDAIAAGDLGKRKQPKLSTAMYGFA
jgi:phage terminase large subunit-like protein